VYPWFTIPPPLPGIGRRSPQRLTLELNQDYLLSSEPQALLLLCFLGSHNLSNCITGSPIPEATFFLGTSSLDRSGAFARVHTAQ